MSFSTYILFSCRLKRYYTGQTNDLKKRLFRHNNGLVKSTKNGNPWKIVFSATTDSRSKAMQLEQKIKKRGAKRFLENLES